MNIDVPDYKETQCFTFDWGEGFYLKCNYSNCGEGIAVISANTEGLMSLAKHLLELSQASVPSGTHIHLDEYNSLENGSIELIIEKI